MRLHPYFDYFQLSAVESRVDTSSDTFYNRGYGTPSADCRIEERAGVLGKLPLTAGGFADDFEYSGHPSATPPPGGSTGWWGEISLSLFFFFSSPLFLFIYLFIYTGFRPGGAKPWGEIKCHFFRKRFF